MMRFRHLFLVLALCMAALPACRPVERLVADDASLRVVVTTTIVGDIVRRIAGEEVTVDILVPPDADPHDYIFKPADLALAAHASVIFINGAGLEGNLDRLLRGVAEPERIVDLSKNVPVRHFDGDIHHKHSAACEGLDVDPHFWTDPNLVMIWAQTIFEELSERVPEKRDAFHLRKRALIGDLEALDHWIQEQVSAIPASRRLLVTDHHAMGYFAARYGFEETGVVIESFDSAAQPSARAMARLVDSLRAKEIPAIFVGKSVNPQLAEQIARDTGTAIVRLYSGALSAPEGPAPDYFTYMRYNVLQIVEALMPREK